MHNLVRHSVAGPEEVHILLRMVRWLTLSILVLALAVTGLFVAVNAGLLTPQIEQQLQTNTGAKVKLGTIRWKPRWPLTFAIGPAVIDHPQAKVQFQLLTAQVASLTPPYDLKLRFAEPRIEVKPLPAQPAQAARSTPTKGGSAKGLPIKLDLAIESGHIQYEQYSISSLQMNFSQKQLMRTPAKVYFKAFVVTPFLPGSIPLTVESDSLTLTEESVKSESTRTWIGGMSAVLQGGSLLKEERHRWSVSVNAPDLSQLPEPPLAIPAKSWKGSIFAKAELTKENAQKPWAAEGTLNVRNLGANLSWNQAGVVIDGPFSSDAAVKFSYADGKVQLPQLGVKVDMTSARVQAAGILDKTAGVSLRADMAGAGSLEQLKIQKFSADLAQLKATLAGDLQLAAPFQSKIQVHLIPTDLKGLENMIVPLRASPVQGVVEAKADIEGPLTSPMDAHIKVSQLKLKNFSGLADYTTQPTFQVKGPFLVNLEAAGEWADKQLKSAQGSGQVTLDKMAMVAGPMRKEANQALNASFNVKNAGAAVQIEKLEAKGFFGSLSVKGTAKDFAAPSVDLTIDAMPLNLTELRMALPAFRDAIPAGRAQGKLVLKGAMPLSFPWPEWPLNVSGNLAVTLPEYQIASTPAPAADAPPTKPPATALNEPFLPSGSLTKSAKVQIKADIAKVMKDQLVIKGFNVTGAVSDGKFRGSSSIQEIFGGQIKATELDVPLLQANPLIGGAVSWTGIVVQDALAFMKDEYKTFASGRAAGQARFSTQMPGHPEFVNDMDVRGDATLYPITLNSVKVGEIINDLLAKVPGLNASPAKLDPLKGTIKSGFELKQGVVQLPQLNAKDLDGSELDLKGTVVLASLQGDLAGQFKWAQPTVKGCLLEGNSDAQGRMVVPLAIKGDLMKPGLSALSDVAGQLASRTLECEKNKFIDKVKKDGGKAIEKELGKALKGILGN